jgi:hypothetical protein
MVERLGWRWPTRPANSSSMLGRQPVPAWAGGLLGSAQMPSARLHGRMASRHPPGRCAAAWPAHDAALDGLRRGEPGWAQEDTAAGHRRQNYGGGDRQ